MSTLKEKALIMDEAAMERAISRIAFEIIEKNKGTDSLAIIGIQRRGVSLAKKITEKIRQVEGVDVPMGILDITLYRDDLSLLNYSPVINGTEIDFMITDARIVLVDDVLYTGRTIRAAIDQLMDFGRPKMIQLAVLVDRGYRELPIRPDYVGKNVPTSTSEVVEVQVAEFDGCNRVVIMDKQSGGENE
ncbi:MAG: bifunctional pyr operon transcriptional regulator/uracil phosphoribosyltransferase PyrR [Ruminococcaceae bacterium]|nr:bifunctional pyr operon transcriptional regulator/uracil phosphoribosyltransferase PyrR [Oscillospiraceae bacterium]